MNKRDLSRRRTIAVKKKKFSPAKLAIKTRDLSVLENQDDSFEQIGAIAVKAGRNAAASARALGIPCAYAKGNRLVEISSQGQVATLSPRINRVSYYVQYKPSTVLHACRK